ncbi:hypothetical protein BH09PSE2_BH09PSE2_04110 [soil metagenome]
MKKMILGIAAAAATVAGMATVAIPTAADAQPRHWEGQRYWHGPARGPGYRTWRQGYYGAYNRYPARSCRVRHGRTVCFYR